MARKRLPISKFKAECLRILDQLDSEGLDITKHDTVIATVFPVEKSSAFLIGSLRGKVRKKDQDDPLYSTGVEWNAES